MTATTQRELDARRGSARHAVTLAQAKVVKIAQDLAGCDVGRQDGLAMALVWRRALTQALRGLDAALADYVRLPQTLEE